MDFFRKFFLFSLFLLQVVVFANFSSAAEAHSEKVLEIHNAVAFMDRARDVLPEIDRELLRLKFSSELEHCNKDHACELEEAKKNLLMLVSVLLSLSRVEGIEDPMRVKAISEKHKDMIVLGQRSAVQVALWVDYFESQSQRVESQNIKISKASAWLERSVKYLGVGSALLIGIGFFTLSKDQFYKLASMIGAGAIGFSAVYLPIGIKAIMDGYDNDLDLFWVRNKLESLRKVVSLDEEGGLDDAIFFLCRRLLLEESSVKL
ncbi:MAG: hypothetical protein AB7F43_10900 [Bacteriovoracia bacterium]